MSSIAKLIVAFAALSAVAGCSNPEPEEIVIIEPAPVVVQPVSGKY